MTAIPVFDGSVLCWCLASFLLAAGAAMAWVGWWRLNFAVGGAGMLAISLACVWVGPALSQDAGPDLQTLLDQAETRVVRQESDIAAWAQSLGRRGDAYAAAAGALQAASQGQIAKGSGLMDDPALRGLGQSPVKPGGGVYVAVSLSMPPQALRALARDAHRCGARVVIRGLVDNSFKATLARVRQVFDDQSAGGVAIDPQVFKAFGVTSVPTIIATQASVQPCGSLGCAPAAPPYDKISGNISLEAALRDLAEDGDRGGAPARTALNRLTG